MENKEKIDRQIEETLKSFDNIQRAEGAPFLLTRILAKMNEQSKSVWENLAVFICRPAVMGCGLFLILLINIAVIITQRPVKNTSISERSTAAPTEEEEYTTIYTTLYTTENP